MTARPTEAQAPPNVVTRTEMLRPLTPAEVEAARPVIDAWRRGDDSVPPKMMALYMSKMLATIDQSYGAWTASDYALDVAHDRAEHFKAALSRILRMRGLYVAPARAEARSALKYKPRSRAALAAARKEGK